MAELAVDPVQLRMSANACDTISVEIRNKIKLLQNALDSTSTWQGRARMATVGQFDQGRQKLVELEAALAKGSAVLRSAGFGFTDNDETAASGIGSAASSALTGPALNG